MRSYSTQHMAHSGFSLLETLVAISILVLAVTGTLTVISTNATTASNAKDRITAFYLAQDALEYVRNVRDTTSITRNAGLSRQCERANPPSICDRISSGGDWLEPLMDCVDSVCLIDTTEPQGSSGAIRECNSNPGGDCRSDPDDRLILHENGEYDYYTSGFSDWRRTPFVREVRIERASDNPDEAIVSVTMYWKPRFVEHEFTISEHMFNWQSGL